MTDDEWVDWKQYFGAAFPDVAKWLIASGADTAAAWRRTFGAMESRDCRCAVDLILSGSIEFPRPYSAFPGTIRQLAQREAGRRRSENELFGPKSKLTASPNSLTKMLKCFLHLLDSGSSLPEARLLMENQFPVTFDQQQRYRCLLCRDEKTVRIWHYRSVESILSNERPFKNYCSVVTCTCGDQPPHYMARFDPDRMCLYGDGHESKLREWIDEWLATRPKRMPGYEGSFEEYAPT